MPHLKKVYLLKLLLARALKTNCLGHLKQHQMDGDLDQSLDGANDDVGGREPYVRTDPEVNYSCPWLGHQKIIC